MSNYYDTHTAEGAPRNRKAAANPDRLKAMELLEKVKERDKGKRPVRIDHKTIIMR